MDWLFKQLPMYQKVGKIAYKADLSNTLQLAEYLDHPERGFKSIHVAGTNGKGSVSHMLASVFQEAGYRVGLYTSPHLKDFRERIKINGECISKNSVIAFVKKHREFFEQHQLSFFEMTVGMAFEYFSNKAVDIAIIEVGMGGRLDSTNIITPELSIITNIGLDHTQYLGTTLAAIAAEKAGIIKKGVPVIIGERHPETEQLFQEVAAAKKAPIYWADSLDDRLLPSDLTGAYQKHNQRTLRKAVEVMQKKGWHVDRIALGKGLAQVVGNTGLMGRWQVLQESPKVICDTAHNKEGLTYVLQQLQESYYNHLHIVLGVVSDKDVASILPLFPNSAIYYFCAPQIPRAMDVELLEEKARAFGLVGRSFNSVQEAYSSALEDARPDDLIFVGGSTFVVAEVL